ncbi:HNH endonuclease [Bacillus cereus]|uniref:HNH endonuclease n=1 Tax=Bacillus mycoides TaxID=1405 RepID=UPI0010423D7E|nr:HNH endonuclease [Bacillus cereus]
MTNEYKYTYFYKNATFFSIYLCVYFKPKNQGKAWLKEKRLTSHHKSSTEIELIPTDLHANIPHIGSASDLRGGK